MFRLPASHMISEVSHYIRLLVITMPPNAANDITVPTPPVNISAINVITTPPATTFFTTSSFFGKTALIFSMMSSFRHVTRLRQWHCLLLS